MIEGAGQNKNSTRIVPKDALIGYSYEDKKSL